MTRKVLITMAYVSLGLYIVFIAISAYVLHFPPRIAIDDIHADWHGAASARDNLPLQDVVLRTADGLKIAAWFVPAPKKTAIVVCEGWGQNRNKSLPYVKLFHDLGYPVITLDFRGQGASDQAIATFGLREQQEVAAAVRYLTQVGYQKVVLFGVSMGGFSELLFWERAQDPVVVGIIVDSIYVNYRWLLEDWFGHHYKLPVVFIWPIQQVSLAVMGAPLQGFSCSRVTTTLPILILRGSHDQEISARHSMWLQHIYPHAMTVVFAAKHAQLLATDEQKYTAIVGSWLRQR